MSSQPQTLELTALHDSGESTRLDAGPVFVAALAAIAWLGDAFRKEIALYADDLKSVGVINAGTNSDRLSTRVFSDVLA